MGHVLFRKTKYIVDNAPDKFVIWWNFSHYILFQYIRNLIFNYVSCLIESLNYRMFC